VRLEILRPDDLLVLGVETTNLELDADAAVPRLIRSDPAADALLTFSLGP
jgi:hypothetical protein